MLGSRWMLKLSKSFLRYLAAGSARHDAEIAGSSDRKVRTNTFALGPSICPGLGCPGALQSLCDSSGGHCLLEVLGKHPVQFVSELAERGHFNIFDARDR